MFPGSSPSVPRVVPGPHPADPRVSTSLQPPATTSPVLHTVLLQTRRSASCGGAEKREAGPLAAPSGPGDSRGKHWEVPGNRFPGTCQAHQRLSLAFFVKGGTLLVLSQSQPVVWLGTHHGSRPTRPVSQTRGDYLMSPARDRNLTTSLPDLRGDLRASQGVFARCSPGIPWTLPGKVS